jgi:hypothetical protein
MKNATQKSIYNQLWLYLQPINHEAEMILKIHLVLPWSPVSDGHEVIPKLESSPLWLKALMLLISLFCPESSTDSPWSWLKKRHILSPPGGYVPCVHRDFSTKIQARHSHCLSNNRCNWRSSHTVFSDSLAMSITMIPAATFSVRCFSSLYGGFVDWVQMGRQETKDTNTTAI